MDGYEASRNIRAREHGQPTPIVALTANASPKDAQQCLDAGMNDILTKPFRRVDLARILELWLQGIQVDGQCLEGDVGFMRCEVEDPGEAVDRTGFDSIHGQLGEDFPELLDAFSASAEDILGQMTEAMAEPEGEDISMLAHSLKSCSANVGAMHLSRLARDLEASAKSGGPWYGKIDALRAEYQRVRRSLNTLRQQL